MSGLGVSNTVGTGSVNGIKIVNTSGPCPILVVFLESGIDTMATKRRMSDHHANGIVNKPAVMKRTTTNVSSIVGSTTRNSKS